MAIKLRVQDNTVNLNAWSEDGARFRVDGLVQVISGGDVYEGPYEVIPRAHNEVILETANKTMEADVTVRRVPYYETSNLFDGKTAYIAEEL